MLHTIVVGLGRSGRGLHLPALARARAVGRRWRLFADDPVLAVNPRVAPGAAEAGDGDPGVPVVAVPSLRAAATKVDPAPTVVHLCTPPAGGRTGTLAELGRLGFHRIVVEKPLALGAGHLAAVLRLRQQWGLDLVVTAQWLTSALTDRLRAAARDGAMGRVRSISVTQCKPRFVRSLTSHGHPTAFDVELPHSLAVALALAGDARVSAASWVDLALGNVEVPHLGQARLSLRHTSGATTEIFSDVMSPTRERRITVELDGGTLTGHYPCSEADDTAQLRTVAGGDHTHLVFHDDSLTDFMLRAYEHFAGRRRLDHHFDLHVATVRLLATAKRLCVQPRAAPTGGPLPPTEERMIPHA